MSSAAPFEVIQIEAAAERLQGVVRETPLVPFDAGDSSIELRLKLECLQETGSFKARGAWNNLSQLGASERGAGVVATSSGNHGRALAWAAERAGVPARIFMPSDAYPNKVQACRDHGAEVVLCPTRQAAEDACASAVAAGAVLVHPYDEARTIEGAGTVGLEIGRAWPAVEVVVFPVGGGGMICGGALALKRELSLNVCVLGAEPVGARTLGLALERGAPVVLDSIDTEVQGLCPLSLGALNTSIACAKVDGAIALDDDRVLDAQAQLVRLGGWTVEPAGAAATAAVFSAALPRELLEGRAAANPLRVAAVVSGGNPDPAQLEALR